ncbi:cob(I)yrinic acid a,c-diamide adenosyltransferase [Desulfuromusa kysingii]|uniref:corrinoid adenosyltransferase n=1 Tax=Desulfuromusa kysingii TaxID=37625 RepID=A0A1H3X0V8_9BACT|nr:cob(I)yrinic acid a,c-diamide adenosyltransferase [Desulfuromusa kysingii]SDZ93039.1 cob(I)yrinic acid a,c-diamide adenosyltransferase [Desulfuromusa kysingii]
MAKNLLIFTGNGKGKSTAAFGMAIRAAGHGQRILILQFMKADDSTGELVSLRDKLGIDIRLTGLGFVPKPGHPKYPAHKEAAQKAFAIACQAMQSGDYDLLILDEICGSVSSGLVDEAQVLEAVKGSRDDLNIVLTGRNATPAMIEMADTVTEMVPHKHALENGVPARIGVEF